MNAKGTPVGVVIAKAGLLAAGLGCAIFWNPLIGAVLLGFWVLCEILVWIGKTRCILIAAVLCTSSVASAQEYHFYNDHAYWTSGTGNLLSDPKYTWVAAADLTVAATPPIGFSDGHLVTISDSAENAFVQSISRGQSAWLGFTDAAQQGEWHWIDDTPGVWQDPDDFPTPTQTAWTRWQAPNFHGDITPYNPNSATTNYARSGFVYSDPGAPTPLDMVWTSSMTGTATYIVEWKPLPVPAPGDVTYDASIDIFDLNLIAGHWGEPGPIADANRDELVDVFDVNLVSGNWAPLATPVPEPSTIALAMLAALLSLARTIGRRLARRTAGSCRA